MDDCGKPEEAVAIGIDIDLQEELINRQKWQNYIYEGEEDSSLGPFKSVIENAAQTIHLRKIDGKVEHSISLVGKDASGKPCSIQLFDGGSSIGEHGERALEEWRPITRACPFGVPLLNVFSHDGYLCLVYELDGSAVSMASVLQASITTGGLLTKSKQAEESLMKLWIGQLLWTIRLVHAEMNWFIGAGLLSSPQNILLTSQNQRVRIAGLGSVQMLALARSPLEYTLAEIRSQQSQDLRALGDLIKTFLSGPRRWLIRSAAIAPIMSYLEQQRSSLVPASAAELLAMPASQNLLNTIFAKSFRYVPACQQPTLMRRRQEYLEGQMMVQNQSERVLGLLCRLNFVVSRFQYRLFQWVLDSRLQERRVQILAGPPPHAAFPPVPLWQEECPWHPRHGPLCRHWHPATG